MALSSKKLLAVALSFTMLFNSDIAIHAQDGGDPAGTETSVTAEVPVGDTADSAGEQGQTEATGETAGTEASAEQVDGNTDAGMETVQTMDSDESDGSEGQVTTAEAEVPASDASTEAEQETPSDITENVATQTGADSYTVSWHAAVADGTDLGSGDLSLTEEQKTPEELVTIEGYSYVSASLAGHAVVTLNNVSFTEDGVNYSGFADLGTDHLTLEYVFEKNGVAEETAAESKEDVTEQEAVQSDDNNDERDAASVSSFNGSLRTKGINARAPRREEAVQTSQDITSYLTKVGFSVNGDDNYNYDSSSQPWEMNADQKYGFQVHFSEKDKNPGFYKDGRPLTYKLPSNLHVQDIDNAPINVTVSVGTTTYVVGCTYSIKDGVLTFNWGLDDPNIGKVREAKNIEIHFACQGAVDAGTTELDFSDTVHENVVTNKGSVTVEKKGTYSISDNKVTYQVKVTSSGVNKNVVVTDTINGTALTYNNDVHATLGYSGTSVELTNVSASGNGFTCTIPEMKDGEFVTLTYTANVDTSKITGKGTIEQTGNKVSVRPEDKDTVNTGSNLENQIKYTDLAKTAGTAGDVVTVDGKPTRTLSWNITANSNQNADMGGHTITDTIAADSSSIMSYTGEGITINVTKPDGSTETRTVKWGEDGTNGKLVKNDANHTWTYTAPAGDGKYKYVISYKTIVDLTGKNSAVTVNNTSTDDFGDSSNGQGKVNPAKEETIGVRKEATSISSKSITWKTTLTVPAGGLSDARVVDTLPGTWLSSVFEIDELTGDVAITPALQDQEWYTVTPAADKKTFTIQFYKDGKDTKSTEHKGLNASATGSPRQIEVVYTTAVNQNWFNSNKTATHTNNVDFNGTTASADAVPTEQGLAKQSVNKVRSVSINGKAYPAFEIQLTLTGIDDSSFDTAGNLTVTDTYPSYMKYLPVSGTTWLDAINNQKSADWFAEAITNPTTNFKKGSLSFAETTGTDGKVLSITAKKSDFPLDNGKYYNQYCFRFYITPADDAALANLASQSITSGSAVKIPDTATWGDLSAAADVEYEAKALSKELLRTDSNNNFAEYSIVINPTAAKIHGGKPMVLTDTFTNFRIDYSSIMIIPNNGDITYDVTGNVLTIKNVPDETTVTVVYSGYYLKSGDLSNTATLVGIESDNVTKSVTANSSGGSGSTPAIRLLKYEKGNMGHGLAGVQFQLYASDGDKIGAPINGAVFTTGEGGLVTINSWTGNGALEFGKTYYLKEIKPLEGYQQDDTAYKFTIDENWNGSYDNYHYPNGDVLKVANKKVTGGLQLTKRVEGNAADSNKQFKFIVTLKDSDDNFLTDPVTVKPATVKKDTTSTSQPLVNGTFSVELKDGETATITDLPDGTTYTVAEADYANEGYILEGVVNSNNSNWEKIGDGDLSGKTTGSINGTTVDSITFTNSRNTVGKLNIAKKTAGNDIDPSAVYTVRVNVTNGGNSFPDRNVNYGTDGNGNAITFTGNNGTAYAYISIKADQTITIENLPNGSSYEVVEQNADDYTKTFADTDGTDLSDGKGTISDQNQNGSTVTLTNTRNTYGAFSLEKKTAGNDPDEKTWFGFDIVLTFPAGTAPTEQTKKYGDVTFVKSDVVNGLQTMVVDGKQNLTGDSTIDVNTLKSDDKPLADHRVVLAKDHKVIISGLPNGVTYKVSEDTYGSYDTQNGTYTTGTINGKVTDPDTPSSDYVIEASNQAKYVNTRDRYGKLKITKMVDSNVTDSSKKFTIKVTIRKPDGTVDANGGPYNGITLDENGSYTFQLGHKESIELTGLQLKSTYLVEELDGTGYTVSQKQTVKLKGEVVELNSRETETDGSKKKNDDVADTIGEHEHTVTVTNTKYSYGGIAFSKAVVDAPEDEIKKNPEFNFTVTIMQKGDFKLVKTAADGTQTSGTITIGPNKKTDIKLKAGESAAILGLNEGTKYSIKENGKEAQESYAVTPTVAEGTVKHISDTPKMEASQVPVENKVKFTNTYKIGKLVLKKTLSGNDANPADTFVFKLTITGDQEFTTAPKWGGYTWTIDQNDKKTVISDISVAGNSEVTVPVKVGYSYRVEETDSKGYTITKQEGVIGKIENAAVAYEAEIENTKNAAGSLSIQKKTSGNAIDPDAEYSFKINLSDTEIDADHDYAASASAVKNIKFKETEDGYTATIKLKKDQIAVLENLPKGTSYTVNEVKATDYQSVWENNTNSGVIEGNSSAALVCTNTRNRFGSLTVSKSVRGNAGDKNKAFAFSVNITLADGKPFSGTLQDTEGNNVVFDEHGIATFQLSDGQTKTIKNVPECSYTITETDPSGYTTTIDNGILKTEKVGGENQTVYDYETTQDSVTVSGQIDPVEIIGDGENASDKTKEYNKSTEHRVSFTNTLNKTGGLHFKKNVTGNDADKTKPFTFTVTIDNIDKVDNIFPEASIDDYGTYGSTSITNDSWKKENGVAILTLDLSDGQEAVLKNLPNGAHYKIVENADGYNSSYTGNAEGIIKAIEADNTVGYDSSNSAVFTNKYEASGELKLSAVKHLDNRDFQKGDTWTFTVTGSEGAPLPENETVKITPESGNDVAVDFGTIPFTLTDAGKTYTYTVTETGSVAGVANDAKVHTVTVKVSDNGDGTLKAEAKYSDGDAMVFTNTYKPTPTPTPTPTPDTGTGGLVIRKTVTGNGDQNKYFNFHIMLSADITGQYGDINFVHGSADVQLKSGDELSAWGIPNGTSYWVTEAEANKDGYTTTMKNETGTIYTGETHYAEFVNKKGGHNDVYTGDHSNLIKYFGTLIASLAAAVFAGRQLRKNR
ncbi:MAG: FctA domain-containing protein [Bulleidia sp.]|nr:FctA domain-containing protein [Bulleidia sp.]